MFPAATLGERISRHDLVRSPHVWFALCATFGLFAVAISGLWLLGWPREASSHRMALLAIGLIGVTVLLARMNAPPPDSPRAHALLALVYVGPAFALWAFQPVGAAAIASAMFIGPLCAMWATRLRDAVLHLSAATLCLALPCILGWADDDTITAVIAIVPAMWLLAGCIFVIFATAEAQGDQLAHLVRRDPLTGAGNRRLLTERLALELPIHAARRQPLALLALDLDGFKALNDLHGHAAGDALLVAVADAIRGAVRTHDVVVRQGGDEFTVLLPVTARDEAERLADAIRAALAAIDAGIHRGAVSSGVGVAVFPADGTDADALLAAADAALLIDKARPRPAAAGVGVGSMGHGLRVAGHCVAPQEAPGASVALADGAGRRELEHHPIIWRAHSLMYVTYALMGALVLVLFPSIAGPAFPFVVAAGGLVGVVFLVLGPPSIGTRYNHAALSCCYLVPLFVLLTCAPGGSMAIGCLIFVGPLAAVRLLERRQIAAHFAIATVLIGGLVPLGLMSLTTSLAIFILIGAMWVLGACCVFVLEAAEHQTQELRATVRRDPLTGIANRRALDEHLADALEDQRQLCLVTLDLNGFKALNDTFGHAAGDALLVAAAETLAGVVGDRGLVARQGGDEFCLVLDGVDASAIPERVAAVREALAAVDCGGAPLTTGAGWACFPEDGQHPRALLDRADARLLSDKAARAEGQRRREIA